MKQNIKGYIISIFLISGLTVVSLLSSCSKWTEPEAMDFYTPPSAEYANNLKDYFKSPHKVMFGWFGNWAGKGGSSKQYELMGLPDSVDFVSLWLKLGNITPEQQADLNAFKARGSKAVYCFTSNDIGKFATPEHIKEQGEEAIAKFWGYDSGKEEDFIKASEKYAMAIVDSCKKYNVDGFDIDMELTGSLISMSHPGRLDAFMKVLRREFDKFDGLLVADIPAGWTNYYTIFTDEVLKSLDYIIWQSYDIADRDASLDNMFLSIKDLKPNVWEEVVAKSILTATFERAGDKQRFDKLPYYSPSFGIDYAGIGAYHIEYDFPGNPDYATIRKASSIQNPPINE